MIQKEFFLDLERILNKDDNIGKSSEAEEINRFEHMSQEKYFWLLRETLMTKMKNLGLKIHDIDQRTRSQNMRLPDMEKKSRILRDQTEDLKEKKEGNKQSEISLKEIIGELIDVKEKRILTEEELKNMKDVLQKLEEKNIQDIEEQIQNTKYKFSMKRRSRRT
jgi:hypothetical protein